ncbi:MAG TPA: hypothetical protein PLZ42_00690 [Methanothrix sp.]|nr:hypothetical protein [Methanothrix sp.]
MNKLCGQFCPASRGLFILSSHQVGISADAEARLSRAGSEGWGGISTIAISYKLKPDYIDTGKG